MDIEEAHCCTINHHMDYHSFSEEEIIIFRRKLLEWYHANRRKLPWRGDLPPYIVQEIKHKKKKNKQTSSLFKYFNDNETNEKIEKKIKPKTEKGNQICSDDKKTKKNINSITKISKPKNKLLIPPVQNKNDHFIKKEMMHGGYATWVSEIMLQQTRVATVISYYCKWMKHFPTIEKLSLGTAEEVQALWAGLGYYRRARFLHQGAKDVVNMYGGKLPQTVNELKKIKGIGDYTAGAIASIAFNKRAPLVDGNVIRVLSRLRAIASDPKNKNLVKLCWKLADDLVDIKSPGNFNQALMELGAIICNVKNPKCKICPVSSVCWAQKEIQAKKRPHQAHFRISPDNKNRTNDTCRLCQRNDGKITTEVTYYPLKAKKKPPRPEDVAVCVVIRKIHDALQFYIIKRKDKGLLAGQWEFPSKIIKTKCSKKKRRECMDSFLAKHFNFNIIYRKDVGDVVHIFSHIKHTYLVEYMLIVTTEPIQNESDNSGMWVSTEKLLNGSLGLTTGVKKNT